MSFLSRPVVTGRIINHLTIMLRDDTLVRAFVKSLIIRW